MPIQYIQAPCVSDLNDPAIWQLSMSLLKIDLLGEFANGY